MKTKLFLVATSCFLLLAIAFGQTSRIATETAGNWGSSNVAHTGSLTISGSQTNSGNLQTATLNSTGAAYFSGGVQTPGQIQAALFITSAGTIRGPASGVIGLYNSSQDDFVRLQFGGTTAGFPALVRSNGNLMVSDAAGTGTTNSFFVPGTVTATNGVCLPSRTNSPPAMSGFGAHLWSDGTNLVVIIGNHGTGTYTTNKVTLSTWP